VVPERRPATRYGWDKNTGKTGSKSTNRHSGPMGLRQTPSRDPVSNDTRPSSQSRHRPPSAPGLPEPSKAPPVDVSHDGHADLVGDPVPRATTSNFGTTNPPPSVANPGRRPPSYAPDSMVAGTKTSGRCRTQREWFHNRAVWSFNRHRTPPRRPVRPASPEVRPAGTDRVSTFAATDLVEAARTSYDVRLRQPPTRRRQVSSATKNGVSYSPGLATARP